MTGAERIAAERKRQIEEEGWDSEHDDDHESDALAFAAACYALANRQYMIVGNNAIDINLIKLLWPWHEMCWKPSPDNRIRELEKAGALIAAEIDRLLRLEASDGKSDDTVSI